jgi:ribosome-binding protein aMBF1 (putative translation factor)
MSNQPYEFKILESFINKISPMEQHRTDNRMMLAAKIAEAMKEKRISSVQLAKDLGKNPSVVTKWLSGTHNFTCDTLSDVEFVLGIKLLQLIDEQSVVYNYKIIMKSDTASKPMIAIAPKTMVHLVHTHTMPVIAQPPA